MLNNGIEAEDARYILPNSSETKMIVTMNARELLHFFTVRCCNRAQTEIRDLATSMLKNVKRLLLRFLKMPGQIVLERLALKGKYSCGNPHLRKVILIRSIKILWFSLINPSASMIPK